MRKIVTFLEIFITFLLQTTVFPAITFISVIPNLLLILTVSHGFFRGKTSGMMVGFVSGLMIDIFYGDYLGFYALIYMLIGYFTGFLYQIYYVEDIMMPVILVAVSDFFYGCIVYVVMFLLRGRTDIFYYIFHIIVPEIVCTSLLTMIFYRIYYKIDVSLYGTGREGQKLPWIGK